MTHAGECYVTLPDIVDHAKANHANALASVW